MFFSLSIKRHLPQGIKARETEQTDSFHLNISELSSWKKDFWAHHLCGLRGGRKIIETVYNVSKRHENSKSRRVIIFIKWLPSQQKLWQDQINVVMMQSRWVTATQHSRWVHLPDPSCQITFPYSHFLTAFMSFQSIIWDVYVLIIYCFLHEIISSFGPGTIVSRTLLCPQSLEKH